MPETPRVDVDRFWRDGYLVVKQLFPKQELQTLREQAYEVLEEQRRRGRVTSRGPVTYIKGDILTQPYLRRLVYDDRILSVVRQTLGGQPLYWGDSNFEIGSGLRGWHKDSRLCDRFDQNAPDWKGRYPLMRFGIYLQDHAGYDGALGLRVGSHNRVDLKAGKAIHLASELGDLTFWNLRISHTGNGVRLKFLPNMKFDTKVEDRIPQWLRRGEQKERIAIFITYGVEHEHTHRYIEDFRNRDYGKDYLLHSRFGDEVWREMEGKDLKVIRPIPEYGKPEEGERVLVGA